ncbi:MAG: SpoIIE family protein phosphatase [Pseudomonadota bacterium]
MTQPPERDTHFGDLTRQDIEDILAVTRALAAPFDLSTLLAEVSAAARRVLHAERSSVWLYDPAAQDLVLKVANDLDNVRVPMGAGLLGACVRDRVPINVPDCYADPRFDPAMDRRTGFHTRCSLTVPLIDHEGSLIGAMQLLNRNDGVFREEDVALAQALAAQCAMALSRVQMMEAMLQGQKLQRELELARAVQMSTLPAAMPVVEGYDVFGCFRPADLTGGDTFDLALLDRGLLVLLADATGHGIAPALDVTQMHAMLRMALRMGADLDTATLQVNNQLAQTLPENRFITAFIGLLDWRTHQLAFHSAGQAPLLLYRAAGRCDWLDPTSFPLAAMPLQKLRPHVVQTMEPGDVLAVLSDGVYEYHDAQGVQFGAERVGALIAAHAGESAQRVAERILEAVAVHAGAAPQEDDITVVIVKRLPAAVVRRDFTRRIDALKDIFEFTSSFAEANALAPGLLATVDFVIEELFTNMVKYSIMSAAGVTVSLAPIDRGIEVELVDYDVDRFDVTLAPDADVGLPAEDRTPGGLGLHLIRRMVDSIEYRYDDASRVGRTLFRKTDPP